MNQLPEHHRRWPWVLFISGWRKRSVLTMPRSARHARWVYLVGEVTKNKEPLKWPDEGVLKRVLDEQEAYVREVERRAGKPVQWMFCFPDGRPIVHPEEAWKRACRRAGRIGLTIHDLKRSAVRQAEIKGMARDTLMAMAGIKTASIYSRYNIQDEQRLRDGAAKLDYQIAVGERKVSGLRRS